VDATYNLMTLEQGDGQVAAANRLVDLAARADRTGDAMAAIEQLVPSLTDDACRTALVELLAALYEQMGERRKLAALLYDAGTRAQDEEQRFTLLRRAGTLALELEEGSTAMLALHGA